MSAAQKTGINPMIILTQKFANVFCQLGNEPQKAAWEWGSPIAYIILIDQFSRNMFRGSFKSFMLDPAARSAAKMAIKREWDTRIDEPARQFFYLPLMHSENQCDQDRAVRLFHTRMPETGHNNIDHARAHREVIRRYGRFPYRNDALGRTSNAQEQEFLKNGGYGAIVREIQQGEKAVA